MPWCSIPRLHPCISPQRWKGGHQGTWPGMALFPNSSLLPRRTLQHTTWCTWTAVVVTWDRWPWLPCPCLACRWVLIRNTADMSLVGPRRKSLYRWHCTGPLGHKESLSRHPAWKQGQRDHHRVFPSAVIWAELGLKLKRTVYLMPCLCVAWCSASWGCDLEMGCSWSPLSYVTSFCPTSQSLHINLDG